MNLPEAIADARLFAPWFKDRATWAVWLVFLKALFGLPMDRKERAAYRACTGRQKTPRTAYQEAWLVCGRRAGKSFILALVGVFLASFKDWRPYLAPGERGVVVIIASDRKQAHAILGYCRALLRGVAMLDELVEREVADGFDLSNGTSIEIQTCSYRAVRGRTIVAALLDEVAFWRAEGSNPDEEVLAALRPAMATIPGAMLLCASSPYSRRGVLWKAWKAHFGRDGDPVLVWQAATRTMNPLVPEATVEEAYASDAAVADAEYGAQFRRDLEPYVSVEVVESCTVQGRHELPPMAEIQYIAFCDPSGGAQDSMTLCICHNADGVGVVDCVRERKAPFSPDDVTKEFAGVLKSYGVGIVVGDRYGGEWPRERFAAHGISYKAADRSKSEFYTAFLPCLNSRTVELPDNQTLAQQLTGLERRTARGGRDSIDHGPRGQDDVANAVAGAVVLATETIKEDWDESYYSFAKPLAQELFEMGADVMDLPYAEDPEDEAYREDYPL